MQMQHANTLDGTIWNKIKDVARAAEDHVDPIGARDRRIQKLYETVSQLKTDLGITQHQCAFLQKQNQHYLALLHARDAEIQRPKQEEDNLRNAYNRQHWQLQQSQKSQMRL
jgi:hypothetical protein